MPDSHSFAIPHAIEFSEPGLAIRAVMVGLCQAGIVRGYMDARDADAQASLILRDYDLRDEEHEELGGTLGPSLFEYENDPTEYFRQSLTAAGRINNTLSAHPDKMYEAIESFESYVPPDFCGMKPRIKPVVHAGMAATYVRALIFDSAQPTIVKIHEDLANVRALAPHGIEIAWIDMVIAHNLYLRNHPGEGSLFMYGKRLTLEQKRDLDERYDTSIATTGYPYPEEEFRDCPVTEIDVNPGDYVAFRADYPHKVASSGTYTEGKRVSWNGFLTILNGETDELLYWT